MIRGYTNYIWLSVNIPRSRLSHRSEQLGYRLLTHTCLLIRWFSIVNGYSNHGNCLLWVSSVFTMVRWLNKRWWTTVYNYDLFWQTDMCCSGMVDDHQEFTVIIITTLSTIHMFNCHMSVQWADCSWNSLSQSLPVLSMFAFLSTILNRYINHN